MTKIKTTIQWWDCVRLVRDAQCTTGSERLLLWALAIRTDPKKRFTCFPSYAQLALDTGLSEKQCRISAKALEKASLIHRKRRGNRSNLFTFNYANLLQIAAGKGSKRVSEPDFDDDLEDDPLSAPDSLVEAPDLNNTDGLEHAMEDAPATESLPLGNTLDGVIGMLDFVIPGHPSLQVEAYYDYLDNDMAECVDMAGSPQRVAEVLAAVFYENGSTLRAFENCSKPGAYLLKCLPAWLMKYPAQLNPKATLNEDSE